MDLHEAGDRNALMMVLASEEALIVFQVKNLPNVAEDSHDLLVSNEFPFFVYSVKA
jgi:hypothetical protein